MSESTRTRQYPPNAGIILAAQKGSKRFYFHTPVGGIMSVPAMNEKQARQLAADEYRGFGPADFEPTTRDADPRGDYGTPVATGRAVNENDIWSLRYAHRTHKYSPRKNPTKTVIRSLLDHWEDASLIPLGDVDALQEADGVGPEYARRIIGAAVANDLLVRPKRGGHE